LAYSMAENGYFDEEPLVAIPVDLPEQFQTLPFTELEASLEYRSFIESETTNFLVVEGNRRLAAVKTLLHENLRNHCRIRNYPSITDKVRQDIAVLPVIIYPTRNEVLPYLGVRHISGIKKWEPYARARYIANMVEQGFTVNQIQQQVGDRSNSALKIYLCYQLIEQVKNEFDIDIEQAENNFSYLMLAVGQGAVKDFLGIPKKLQDINLEGPVPPDKLISLQNLFSWLFGEGKERRAVIDESRDITSKLAPVLRVPESIAYLIRTRNLNDAYERSDGEEQMLIKNLNKATQSLEKSLSLVARYKTEQVKGEISRIKSALSSVETLLNS
jgi:hypothetical protein